MGESVGADADLLSADGYRPLFIAAVLGHIGTSRVLVEEGGADVEARQGGKSTTFLANMMGTYLANYALKQVARGSREDGTARRSPQRTGLAPFKLLP